jgi:hypothetical protein
LITLVVQDGSSPEGANSYASVEFARALASSRGRSFPADTEEGNEAAKRLLLNAMDAIEARAAEFQGVKTDRDQPTQFPREGVEVEGHEYDADEIPPQLPLAQSWLAIESQTAPLVVNSSGERLLGLKVEGAVDLKFADDGVGRQPTFPIVEALLGALCGSNAESTFGAFVVERA